MNQVENKKKIHKIPFTLLQSWSLHQSYWFSRTFSFSQVFAVICGCVCWWQCSVYKRLTLHPPQFTMVEAFILLMTGSVLGNRKKRETYHVVRVHYCVCTINFWLSFGKLLPSLHQQLVFTLCYFQPFIYFKRYSGNWLHLAQGCQNTSHTNYSNLVFKKFPKTPQKCSVLHFSHLGWVKMT